MKLTVTVTMAVAVTMAVTVRDCHEVVKLAGCWWRTVAVKMSVTLAVAVALTMAMRDCREVEAGWLLVRHRGRCEKKILGILTMAISSEMCLGHLGLIIQTLMHGRILACGARKLTVRIHSSLQV